ncbi:MAG: hypothetical protein HZB66_03420 [Candidatus Aenigmarchaeota archaeon]|nr:hypothetical protein [Candidatus Aenigmarchaeota archaeon]
MPELEAMLEDGAKIHEPVMSVGTRTIRDTYENGEVVEHHAPIDRYLRIHLETTKKPQELDRKEPKPSLWERFCEYFRQGDD